MSGISSAIGVAAGWNHTCALLGDGTVRCWGDNGNGQIGDGSAAGTTARVARQVVGISNAVAVSAGANHSCALLGSGAINCWGDDQSAELGDGGQEDHQEVPVAVAGIQGATAVAAGAGRTCAILTDTTVRCWGNNGDGALGNGTRTSSPTPVGVQGISGVIKLALGGDHACALVSTGAAKCWGANGSGQLGTGSHTASNVPVSVSGLISVSDVVAMSEGTCARSGATVKCWGANDYGQLGRGSTAASSSPVAVVGAPDLTGLAGGDDHVCGITTELKVTCWGHNLYGQLGNGESFESVVPTTVAGTAGTVSVTAGNWHACSLLTSGTVTCWGTIVYPSRGLPTPVSGIGPAASLASGPSQDCAALVDRTVACWGNNPDGQLGHPYQGRDNEPPSLVPNVADAVSVAASWKDSCALLATGSIQCWGAGFYLGAGTGVNSSAPVEVSGIDNATQIAGGFEHACALLSDRTVKCWGRGDSGQLGDGTGLNQSTPVNVAGLTDAVSIAAGEDHSCALRAAGTVVCWGSNRYLTPRPISGLSNVASIGAGRDQICAVLTDGAAICSSIYTLDALQVVSDSGTVAFIAPGNSSFFCIRSTAGDTRCWGNNLYGQLGTATAPEFRASPVLVNDLIPPPDTTPPTAASAFPRNGAYFLVGDTLTPRFNCADDPGGSGVVSCVGPRSTLDTDTAGAKTYDVVATDVAGNHSTTTFHYTVMDPVSAGRDLPVEGGTVSTAPEGTAPTALAPVVVTLASPSGGHLDVSQQSVTTSTPNGFELLGVQLRITAPSTTRDVPLVFTFDFDAALLPSGTSADSLSILKDGVLLNDCLGASVVPEGENACITSRTPAPSGDGDLRLVVVTTSASTWVVASGTFAPPTASVSSTSVVEHDTGATDAHLTITLSAPSAKPVTVDWATANRTAVGGTDFVSASGTATITAGGTSAPITVQVLGDTAIESDETFAVTLSAPSNAIVGDNGIVTITDDDAVISVGDQTLVEGDSGSNSMKFAVTLPTPSPTPVSVKYAVIGDSATRTNIVGSTTDLIDSGSTRTLKFVPSKTTGSTPIVKYITVKTVGDVRPESNEAFHIQLSAPTGGYKIGRGQGIGTLIDDDASGGLKVAIGDGAIVKAESGKQSLSIPLTMSSAPGATVVVLATVAPETATYGKLVGGGADFGGSLTKKVSFAATATGKAIVVPIWSEQNAARDERFSISISVLSGPSVSVSRALGYGTILAG